MKKVFLAVAAAVLLGTVIYGGVPSLQDTSNKVAEHIPPDPGTAPALSEI